MRTPSAALVAFALLGLVAGCKRKPPSPVTLAAADGGAGPNLTAFGRACASQGARNDAEWARPGTQNPNGMDKPSTCDGNGPYSACVETTPTSGWLIAVDHAAFSADAAFSSCEFEWRLVFVDVSSDGGAIVRAERKFKGSGGYGQEGLSQLTSIGAGAGGDAVFMERTNKTPNDGDVTQPEGGIYVVRDHAIVRYPELAKRNIDEVKDVDGDGRPDLILTDPFVTQHGLNSNGMPMMGKYVSVAQPIAHALADGTYSFDDAIAESLARKACPSKPSPTPPKIDRGEPASEPSALSPLPNGSAPLFAELETWIACSKLWGVPTAEVKNALRTCKSFIGTSSLDTDDHGASLFHKGACPDHLRDWANTNVPFVLH
jgi:hypothetical protein